MILFIFLVLHSLLGCYHMVAVILHLSFHYILVTEKQPFLICKEISEVQADCFKSMPYSTC